MRAALPFFRLLALSSLISSSPLLVGAFYSFDICKTKLEKILDGHTVDGITNQTVQQYIYRGQVTGLDTSLVSRDSYLAINYEGQNLLPPLQPPGCVKTVK